MGAFLDSLTTLQKFFVFCAVIGGVVFLIRLILLFVVGAGHDADAGGDVGGGADAHFDGGADGHISHGDADTSFTILSLQGVTAFFLMFGLIGLALSKQSGAGDIVSVAGGLVAGIASMWAIAKIFQGMRRLQADGTLDIANAIGEEGTVYLRIPPGGTGKAQVTVQGQSRIFNAVTEDKAELKSSERIRVVKVVSGNILVVTKA